MGNRFGRNQRRRMNQQLAAAAEFIAGQHVNTRLLERLLDEKRRNLEFIREAILSSNEYSTLLPPQCRQTTSFDKYGRLEIRKPAPSVPVSDDIGPEVRISAADMAMVATAVASDSTRYGYHMHLFLEGAGSLNGEWRYAIARRSLEQNGIHPRVVEEIAHRLARQLIAQFLRDLGRARRG